LVITCHLLISTSGAAASHVDSTPDLLNGRYQPITLKILPAVLWKLAPQSAYPRPKTEEHHDEH
jgi:hypothetical protein